MFTFILAEVDRVIPVAVGFTTLVIGSISYFVATDAIERHVTSALTSQQLIWKYFTNAIRDLTTQNAIIYNQQIPKNADFGNLRVESDEHSPYLYVGTARGINYRFDSLKGVLVLAWDAEPGMRILNLELLKHTREEHIASMRAFLIDKKREGERMR